jgi:hypothetical protein
MAGGDGEVHRPKARAGANFWRKPERVDRPPTGLRRQCNLLTNPENQDIDFC